MFISKTNLCNYSDDNAFYASGKNLNQIRKNLEMDFIILHKRFHENRIVLNPEKYHYVVIGSQDPPDY